SNGSTSGSSASGSSAGSSSSHSSSSGSSSSGSSSSGSSSSGSSSSGSSSADPLGCSFMWGEPLPSGSVSSDSWLQFMTNWAGYEIQANGSISSFDNGSFV